MRAITSLVVAAAAFACGGDNVHHLNDGGADAPQQSPDGPPQPDAPPAPGVVTVTVTLQSQPAQGVQVYFQNADSSLVAGGSALTDGSGVASVTMEPGGFVTVIEPQFADVFVPLNQGVSTFGGVKPGDQLRDDVDPLFTSFGDSETFELTVPTDPNVATSSYELLSECGNPFEQNITPIFLTGKRPADVALNPPEEVNFSGCGGSADVVIETTDVNGNLVDALVATGIPAVDGSGVTLTGTYGAFATAPIVLTDVPPEFSSAQIELELGTPRGFLIFEGAGVDVSTGSGSGSVLAPPTLAGGLGLAELDLFPVGSIVDQQRQATWGSDLPTSIATDVGATRLRNWVTQPQVDTANQTLEWVVAKLGQTPDFLVTTVHDNRQDPTNDTTDSWTWNIAAPGDEDGHIVYPTLPTDLFDFNFRDTDEVFVDQLVGVQATGGYDAARPLVIDTLNDIGLDDPSELALASASGSVVIQSDGGVGLRAKRRHARPHRSMSINGRAVRSAAPAAR